MRGLEIEQVALVLGASAVLADRPVGADDAMRGDHERDRRVGARRTDRAMRPRRPGLDRDLTVARRLAVGDAGYRFQRVTGEAADETQVQRDLERRARPFEVLVHLAEQRVGIVVDRCRLPAQALRPRCEDGAERRGEELEADEAGVARQNEGIAEGRGMDAEACRGHVLILLVRALLPRGERPPGGQRAGRVNVGRNGRSVRRVANPAKLGRG